MKGEVFKTLNSASERILTHRQITGVFVGKCSSVTGNHALGIK